MDERDWLAGRFEEHRSRLRAVACWDADAVRDDLRGYVVENWATRLRCWWWTRRAFSRAGGCSALQPPQ